MENDGENSMRLSLDDIRRISNRIPSVKSEIIPLLDEAEAIQGRSIILPEDVLRLSDITATIQLELARILFKEFEKSQNNPPEQQTLNQKTPVLLDNLNTDGKNFAMAETQMFFSPWSDNFVHGADSMIFVTKLIEEILQENERLTKMKCVSWRGVMQNNLYLSAYAQKFPILKNRQDYNLEAVFETSDGRTITVLGMDNPYSPIRTKTRTRHPIGELFFQNLSVYEIKDDGTYIFSIKSPLNFQNLSMFLNNSQALLISTLMEILTYGITGVANNLEINSVLRLIGKVRDLPLPENFKEIFTGDWKLKVKLHEKEQKRAPSGFIHIPFEYQFPHQENPSIGITALADSEDVAMRCMREQII
jgi:hypothetical protein